MKVYDGNRSNGSQETQPDRIKVGIAEYKVTTDSAVLTTSGLGSCIGIGIYDEVTGAAGLVHIMLPSAENRDDGNRAKYADTGIEALVDSLKDAGAKQQHLRAKFAGGSDMLDFSESGDSIGSRNARKVREKLEELNIPILGEDVGGDHGRSLRLKASTGDLVVKSANTESATL